MKSILKFEEFAMFLFGMWLFGLLNLSWWWFAGFFFVPDVGMIGYTLNSRTGAFTYNLFHHKGLAIVIGLTGHWPGSRRNHPVFTFRFRQGSGLWTEV